MPTAVFMLKVPVSGMVKTRLAAALGPDKARAIYRRMVERVFRELPDEWSVEVHGTPPEGLEMLASWLGDGPIYRPQSNGDLGLRMVNACGAALAGGAESVVLLGGDCPWHTRAYFEKAASALLTHDLVIGPARDGGYTLLALKQLNRTLFEGIAWSTACVLAETLDRARSGSVLRSSTFSTMLTIWLHGNWHARNFSRTVRIESPATCVNKPSHF